MLTLTAHGVDSCPMEGFDEPRVKQLLGPPHTAEIVMVMAAGRGAADGVIPQIRFNREHYIARVYGLLNCRPIRSWPRTLNAEDSDNFI